MLAETRFEAGLGGRVVDGQLTHNPCSQWTQFRGPWPTDMAHGPASRRVASQLAVSGLASRVAYSIDQNIRARNRRKRQSAHGRHGMIVAPGRVSSRPHSALPEVPRSGVRFAELGGRGPLFDLLDLAISGAIEISQRARFRRSCVCPPGFPGAACCTGCRRTRQYNDLQLPVNCTLARRVRRVLSAYLLCVQREEKASRSDVVRPA